MVKHSIVSEVVLFFWLDWDLGGVGGEYWPCGDLNTVVT